MTPLAAVRQAIDALKENGNPDDAELIAGLEHARECLLEAGVVLRHIRSRVPTYEPELYKLITQQLLRGCDIE